jgi:hypothetical protein
MLTPLPFVVHVETNPPGAQLSIGARRGTSPGDISIGPAFRGMLGVTARMKGYETANRPLRVEDFTQTADSMLAHVSLTLTPLPAPAVAPTPSPAKPRPRPVAPPPRQEPKPETAPEAAAPAEKPVEAPAPPPAADKPAPAPAPDKLPANPFNE